MATGKNWNIPVFWGPLLRFISSPILAIVYSFGYPEFHTLRNDPPYIFGFILAHIVILAVVSALVFPRYLDVFIPPERRLDGVKPVAPNILDNVVDAQIIRDNENGSQSESQDEKEDRRKALQEQGLIK